MDFDQSIITEYFNERITYHHQRESLMKERSPKSGFSLIEQIDKNADILDVGCGKNLFKNFFPNLIGIDPIGTEADYNCCLLDFHTDKKFDVVLCLGSILGSINDIRTQIKHITGMLKPHAHIYWRTQPALPTVGPWPAWFYPWREETHYALAQEFNFNIEEISREEFVTPNGDDYRIFAKWTSNI